MDQSPVEHSPAPTPAAPDRAVRGCLPRMILFLAEIALLVALSLYIVVGAEAVPFHGDEATILYTTRDVSYLLDGQMRQLLYAATPESISPTAATEQELRLLNGTVARYIYGLAAINPRTRQPYEPINEQWDWGADYAYNVAAGHLPAPRALLQARLISSLFLVGAMLFLYGAARHVGGPLVAVIAVLYFVLHPAVLINGRRAMQESVWLCFGLLSVLLAMGLCASLRGVLRPDRYSRGKSIGRYYPVQVAGYLYLGMALGLALASKHTALFYVAAVVGAVMFAPLFAKRRVWFIHIFGVPFMLVVMSVTFLALNPSWWGNPIERLNTVLSLRADLLAGQAQTFGGYTRLSERIDGLLQQGFLVTPQYYDVEGWQDAIGGQIAAYEALPWDGIAVGGIGALVILVLVVIGLIVCVRAIAVDFRTQPDPVLRSREEQAALLAQAPVPPWVSPMGAWVALWLGAAALGAALLTPLAWQRYYLPLYPAIALFLGVGVVQIVRLLTRPRRPMDALEEIDVYTRPAKTPV